MHSRALALVKRKGAAVTFSRTTQGGYDAETDTATPSTSTVVGHAVRVQGDPERYAGLGLVEAKAVTLLFAPTTIDEQPSPGDEVTWDGVEYTVRDVDPVAPDGDVIVSSVVIAR